MSTIDNRVVNMQFNNGKFESGVSQTLGTLQKLKQALKFDNRKTGLEGINDAAKKVDLSTINNGIDQVNNRFSTLSVIGRTVLQNLTNTAVNTGKSIFRSLVGKITSGGISRALNIEQARFQIQGLGKDWNKLSEDINYGVQDTAYGFDEAAKAAAVMSASGVEAGKEMKGALRGISGLAAMTGSSYTEVADIVGTIAGSGKVMTEQLRQFEHRGINVAAQIAKAMNKSEAEIRDMVTKGKISFKEFATIMNEAWGEHATDASKMFTGAVSNVKAALSRIGAMFVQPAIAAVDSERKYKNLTDVIRSVIDALKAFEAKLKDSTLLKTYLDLLDKGSTIASKFFDAISGDTIKGGKNGIEKVVKTQTEKWGELRKSLGLTEQTFKNIGDTFKGITSIFKILGHLISGVVNAITPGVKTFGSFAEVILSATGAIGRFITNIEESISKSKAFEKAGSGIAKAFEGVANVLSAVAKGIAGAFSNMNGGKSIASAIGNIFGDLGKNLGGITKTITTFFNGVAKVIESGFRGLGEALNGGGVADITQVLNTIFTGGILLKITDFVQNFKDTFTSLTSGGQQLADSIGGLIGSVTGYFEEMQNTLKADTLRSIAIAIGIFAGSLWVLASINPERMDNALTGMAGLLMEIMAMMFALTKMDLKSLGGMKIAGIATAMIGISAAVLILSQAAKQLASLNINELAKGLGGIGVLLTEMGVFLNATKKLKVKPKSMVGLLLLSATLKVLASVVNDLAKVNTEGLAKGLVGIGAMLGEIAAFMYLIKGIKINLKSMVGLIVLGEAIKIIADAMKSIGSLNLESLSTGLVGLGFLLGEIAAFMKLVSGAKGALTTSVGVYILAQAITELSGSIKVLGSLNEEQIASGLLAMSGALVIIAGAMRIMPKPATMLLTSVGLVVVASAISSLAKTIQSIGGTSWDSIAKGLIAIGGALIILTIAMRAMKSALAGAAAMLVVAGALSILAPVLTTLGKMSLEGIAKALVALAGAFAVFGIAAALLSPVIPMMAALGAAVAVLGVGLFAAGAGIAMFATGLLNIARNATLMLESVPNLIKIFGAFLDGLVELAPKMALLGVNMMVSFLDGLRQSAPKLIGVAADLIVIFLSGFAKKAPDIVNAAFDLIESLVIAIAKGIQKFSDKIKAAGKLISAETFKVISDALLELSAATFILSKINPLGAIKAVAALAIFANGLGLLLVELGALAQIPGLKYLVGEGGELLGAIGGAIGKLVGGFAAGVAGGFIGALPKMAQDLSTFMVNLTPFIMGAKMLDASILTSIKSFAGAILALTSAKLQDSIANFLGGGSSFSKFGQELNEFVPSFISFSDQISQIDKSAIKNVKVVSDVIAALSEAASKIPNEGGLSAAIFGDNTLSDFAKHLGTFATEFSSVAANMAEIPKDAFSKVKQVAKAAQELASIKIENSGGAVSLFTGDNDLGTLAEHLGTFGKKFASLSKSLKDVSEDSIAKIKQVAKVAQVMASIKIENSGGAVSLLTGDNDLGTLADSLKKFGEKVVELSKSVKDVSEDSITKIIKLSKIATVFGNFKAGKDTQGIKTLQVLGPLLPSIGKNLAGYAKSVAKIDTAGAEKANNFIPKLFNSIAKVSGKGMNVAAIGPALIDLGKGIKSYAKNVAGIKGDELGKVADKIASAMKKIKSAIKNANLKEAFESSGGKAASAFAKSISESVGKAKTNAKNLATAAANAMDSTSKFTSAGKKVAGAFVDGIGDKKSSASSAGKALGSSASSGASGSNLYGAGSDAAQGFVNGVRTKTGAAFDAGYSVGKATIAGAREALRSQSPSREMMKVGHDFDNGFIIGIEQLKKKVGQASYKAGEESIRSVKKAFKGISSITDIGEFSDPVIKPVIDLTDVKRGANDISGMFNNRYAIGLASGNAQLKSARGLQIAAMQSKQKETTVSKPVTITNNITVDGSSDPAKWADEFMQELEVQVRSI